MGKVKEGLTKVCIDINTDIKVMIDYIRYNEKKVKRQVYEELLLKGIIEKKKEENE